MSLRVLALALAMGLIVTAASLPSAVTASTTVPSDDGGDWRTRVVAETVGGPTAMASVLERAVTASRTVPHEGRLVVVSFGETGPRIAQMEITSGDDGRRIVGEGGTVVGRIDGRGVLSSSWRLLQVGGVERVPASLDRLRAKYVTVVGDAVVLDTGPAVAVTLRERETDLLREVLYADVATDLIVRRETYGRNGVPNRTVAYTHLEVSDRAPSLSEASGRDVRGADQQQLSATDAAARRAAGFVVPDSLPHGYGLVTVLDVPNAPVPTLHLIYADGLYSLSVFRQQGRMNPDATAGAFELRTPDGGAVWRWPGSEPRRIIWSGGGATFTAFADTPTDELLGAIAGLPADPPPSILSRLDRGLSRLTRWISPNDRSDT